MQGAIACWSVPVNQPLTLSLSFLSVVCCLRWPAATTLPATWRAALWTTCSEALWRRLLNTDMYHGQCAVKRLAAPAWNGEPAVAGSLRAHPTRPFSRLHYFSFAPACLFLSSSYSWFHFNSSPKTTCLTSCEATAVVYNGWLVLTQKPSDARCRSATAFSLALLPLLLRRCPRFQQVVAREARWPLRRLGCALAESATPPLFLLTILLLLRRCCSPLLGSCCCTILPPAGRCMVPPMLQQCSVLGGAMQLVQRRRRAAACPTATAACCRLPLLRPLDLAAQAVLHPSGQCNCLRGLRHGATGLLEGRLGVMAADVWKTSQQRNWRPGQQPAADVLERCSCCRHPPRPAATSAASMKQPRFPSPCGGAGTWPPGPAPACAPAQTRGSGPAAA